MWLGRIIPPLFNGEPTLGLEHYTTLVIQGIDLGIIVPVSMLGAVLLLKRKPFGFLLTSVLMVKMITLLSALTAMIIGQAIAGVEMSAAEMTIFPVFNLLAIYTLFLIMKNIREPIITRDHLPIAG
ncbi:hypothetical protein [Bacillus sp. T3]|uniref:hypothetical protein n=1 Tax=Bacillus sp. T3 TaxID=467262 RepID=UPI0029822F64|nr:hypothetical protein [Bacillus sp. T3]